VEAIMFWSPELLAFRLVVTAVDPPIRRSADPLKSRIAEMREHPRKQFKQ